MKTVAPHPPLPGQESRRSTWVVWLCGAGALVLVLIVLGVGVAVGFVASRGVGDHSAGVVEEDVPVEESDSKPEDPAPGTETVAEGGGEVVDPVGEDGVVDRRDPMEDLRRRKHVLELPQLNLLNLLEDPPSELATIYTDNPEDCLLELLPGLVAPGDVVFELKKVEKSEKGCRAWDVVRGLDPNADINNQPQATPVGRFVLQKVASSTEPGRFEQTLAFVWRRQVSVSAQLLRFMQLRVRVVDEHTAVCNLIAVAMLKPTIVQFGEKALGPDLSQLAPMLRQSNRRYVFFSLQQVQGFPTNTRVRGTMPNGVVKTLRLNVAGPLLQGIPLGDERQLLVSDQYTDTVLLKVVVRFEEASEDHPRPEIRISWQSAVPVETGEGCKLELRSDVTLAEARKMPGRLRMMIDRLEKEASRYAVEVAELERQLPQIRLLLRGQLLKARRTISDGKNAIKRYRQAVIDIKKLAPQVDHMVKLMDELDGKSTICWRISVKKQDGRKRIIATTK